MNEEARTIDRRADRRHRRSLLAPSAPIAGGYFPFASRAFARVHRV
jgi:hypothetical protein